MCHWISFADNIFDKKGNSQRLLAHIIHRFQAYFTLLQSLSFIALTCHKNINIGFCRGISTKRTSHHAEIVNTMKITPNPSSLSLISA